MKYTITLISLLFCLKLQAQTDSSKLSNFALQARAVEYLAGNLVNPDNEDYFTTFLKWRTVFRASQPTGTTVVTIDTLPVNTAIYLYNWTLSSQEGFSFTALLKNALTPYRSANSNLDRQMTAVEQAFQNQIIVFRAAGRKWLIGK